MKLDRGLVLLAVLAVLGVAAALWAQNRAFPVASIEFRVDRQRAGDVARAFLQRQNFDLSGYRQAISFETDGDAQSYVERKLGLSELNRLARGDISVWHWRVRYFRELQKEELTVLVDPIGRVVGLSRQIPEDTPGPTLSATAAREDAEQFLRSKLGVDLSRYDLISAGQEKRPNRLDQSFVWERRDYKVADATYRLYASIQGDSIGSYGEALRVPEDWLREQRKESGRGAVLNAVGWGVTYGFGAVLLVVFLFQMRAGRVRWRFVFVLSAVLLTILVVAGINSIPLLLINYPTTSTMGAYLWGQAQSYLNMLLPEGVLLVLAGAVGVEFWRRLFPFKPSLHLLLTWRGIRSTAFARSILAGYLVAGIWLGYVSVFYWIGTTYLGVWSPVETPYQDIMSTLLPAVYPLTVGAGAAINEELFFRLFAVPLLLLAGYGLLARKGWSRDGRGFLSSALVIVALVVPAVTWATLHTTYPQQPFYIRALEIAVVGIGQGLLLLRFGVLSTITGHYTYNAMIVGWLFILSGIPYLQVSAVLVPLLPALLLVPAAIDRLRGNRLAPDAELIEPLPPGIGTRAHAEASAAPELPPSPSRRGWIALAVAAIVGLGLGIFLGQGGLTTGLRLSITPGTAQKLADGYLEQLGLPTSGWTKVTQFVDWSLGNHTAYLMRTVGKSEAGKILTEDLRPYMWETRYFKPLEKEDVRLRLDPSGELWSISHALPDAQPGAQLSEPEARALADSFVGRMPDLNLADYALVSSSDRKQDARVDHTFIWERKDIKVGEGSLRLQVTVVGAVLGELSRFFKTPEAFDRTRATQTGLDAVLGAVRSLLGLIITGAVLVLFVLRFRRYDIDLRLSLGMAGVVVGLSLLSQLNQLSVFLVRYPNTLSVPDYTIRRITDLLVGLGFLFGQTAVVVGVAESLYRERFPRLRLLRDQLWGAVSSPSRATRNAALLALGVVPLVWGANALYQWSRENWAASTLVPEPEVPTSVVNSFLPALSSLFAGLSNAITLSFVAAAVLLLSWKYLGRWAILAVPVGMALLLGTDGQNVSESWPSAVAILVAVFLALALYRYVTGPGFLSYPLAIYAIYVLRDSVFLALQPEVFYLANGIALILLVVLPALWLMRPLRRVGTQSIARDSVART